jgi:hypothetical protein
VVVVSVREKNRINVAQFDCPELVSDVGASIEEECHVTCLDYETRASTATTLQTVVTAAEGDRDAGSVTRAKKPDIHLTIYCPRPDTSILCADGHCSDYVGPAVATGRLPSGGQSARTQLVG